MKLPPWTSWPFRPWVGYSLNGLAYNRTAHLPERCKMMQQWADMIEGMVADEHKVIPIKRAVI